MIKINHIVISFCMLIILISCSSQEDVLDEVEAKTICSKVEDIYSKGDTENLSDVLDSSYVLYSPFFTTGISGLEVIAYNIESNARSFPDYKMKIDSFYVKDNIIFYFWSASGTNTGHLGRMPSTGKSISISGITLSKVRNGKIFEDHQYWNVLDFYKQLGFQINPPSAEVK